MEQEAAEVVGDDKRQVEETVKSYPNYHHGGDAPIGRKSSVLNVVVSGFGSIH